MIIKSIPITISTSPTESPINSGIIKKNDTKPINIVSKKILI